MPEEDELEKPKTAILWVLIVFLQLVATQVFTFIASFLFPNMNAPEALNPWFFAIILAITFSLGVFTVGWLGYKLGWLKSSPNLSLRLACTLVGAFIFLAVGILVLKKLEPGNPFFGLSILGSLVGFHLPTWIKK